MNKITEKIKEIGETPIPLKHVAVIVTIAVLAVRPPRTWFVTTSHELHRV
jgi:hypothetical protein